MADDWATKGMMLEAPPCGGSSFEALLQGIRCEHQREVGALKATIAHLEEVREQSEAAAASLAREVAQEVASSRANSAKRIASVPRLNLAPAMAEAARSLAAEEESELAAGKKQSWKQKFALAKGPKKPSASAAAHSAPPESPSSSSSASDDDEGAEPDCAPKASSSPSKSPEKPAAAATAVGGWGPKQIQAKCSEGAHSLLLRLQSLRRTPPTPAALKRLLQGFVEGPLPFVMNIIVVANALLMFMEYEWRGHTSAVSLGLDSSEGWEDGDVWFAVLDHLFHLAFVLELILGVAALRGAQFYAAPGGLRPAKVLDAASVVAISVELYVLRPSGLFDDSVPLLGLLRSLRVLRCLRLLPLMASAAGGVRRLCDALREQATSLLSAAALLLLLIFITSSFLSRMLSAYVEDGTIDRETRLWLFRHYGTSARACYTVFEVTFSGQWPTYVRPVLEEVSAGFFLVFGSYVLAVTFGLLRIASAVFVCDLLRSESTDFSSDASSLSTVMKAIQSTRAEVKCMVEKLRLTYPSVRQYDPSAPGSHPGDPQAKRMMLYSL